MKKVTYGVTGLIDWNAKIPVGRAHLAVHFSGGAHTKYGVIPAEFTTTDPFTQRVIEDSVYFRSGKIFVVSSVGRHDTRPLSRKEGTEAQSAYAKAMLPVTEEAASEVQPPTILDGTAIELEVACLEDAIEYLRANYSVPSFRVRNKSAAQSIAAQHGVKFIFRDEP